MSGSLTAPLFGELDIFRVFLKRVIVDLLTAKLPPSHLRCPVASVSVGHSAKVAIPRETRRPSERALRRVLVINVPREMFIDRIFEAESEIQGILRPCRSS